MALPRRTAERITIPTGEHNLVNHEIVIDQQTIGDMVVLRPAGDIDMARSSTVRKAVSEVVRVRPAKLVMDLTSVEYMDSSGIATLIEGLQSSMRNKMKFVLVGVTPKVRSAFEITKLIGMFTICANIDDAAKI